MRSVGPLSRRSPFGFYDRAGTLKSTVLQQPPTPHATRCTNRKYRVVFSLIAFVARLACLRTSVRPALTTGCLQSAHSWTQFRNVVKSRVKSRDCVVTGGRVNSDASRTTRPVGQVPTGASWPLQGGRDACKRTGHQGR